MGFQDRIYANKEFIFFKQLMRNIALAICIMLIGVLILVYGFKFQLYNVITNSEAPYFVAGDMVVARAQKEYKAGDIIKFRLNERELPVTHRLIGVVKNDAGQEYYICHGDNVGSANPAQNGDIVHWSEDAKYVKTMTYDEIDRKYNKASLNSDKPIYQVQIIRKEHIDGKVLFHLDNFGTYISFIKNHTLLLVTIVGGIWCISGALENEQEMRRNKRFDYHV